jgi:hypothetical protein
MRLVLAATTAFLASVEAQASSSTTTSDVSNNNNNRAAWKVAHDNQLLPNRDRLLLFNNKNQKLRGVGGGPIQRRRRRRRHLQRNHRQLLVRHHQQQKQKHQPSSLKNTNNNVPPPSSSSSPSLPKECNPQAADVGILSCGLTQYCRESAKSKLGGFCTEHSHLQRAKTHLATGSNSRLTNNTPLQQQQPQHECDPNVATATTDADVGILSCPSSRQYCQESASSSLGGVCVVVDGDDDKSDNKSRSDIGRIFLPTPRKLHRAAFHQGRHLQQQQQLDYSSFDSIAENLCTSANYTCTECSYGDAAAAGQRSFDCSYAESYCGALEDFCGTAESQQQQACYNYAIAGTQDATQLVLTICSRLESPAQLEYCYSRIAQVDSEEYTCTFSINGQECSGCTVVGPGQGGGDGDDECLIFDCENIADLPVSGNSCTFDFDVLRTRAIQNAIFPCEFGCNLCADNNEIIGNPSAIVTLEQGDAECSSVAIGALTGYGPFGDAEYCASLNALAGETCGCYDPTDGVYVPNTTAPTNATTSPMTTPTTAPTTAEEEEEETFFTFVSQYICADGGGETYVCSVCDVDLEARTATFDCAVPEECNDVASFCTDPLPFCYSQTIKGSVTNDETWEYEFCSAMKAQPSNGTLYQFEYCVTYNVAPDDDDDTCVMTVDGITCTSCQLTYDAESNSYRASYDCTNTVLGRMGDGETDLQAETEEYFVYKALPCPGGCNLCGDGDALMTNQEATFTTEEGGAEQICFQAQLDALVGPTEDSVCQALRSSVQQPCECKEPPTPAPAPEPLSPDGAVSLGSPRGVMAAVAAALVAVAGAVFAALE